MNWNQTWICPANDLGDPAAVFGTSFVFEKKITHANLTLTYPSGKPLWFH